MSFSSLPPVRRPVPLARGRAGARSSMEGFFGNRKITLYASGTAALSHAITGCVSRSSVKSPEVIIPAYGCPDLVAACVSASVWPRLVEVATTHWAYEPGSLEASLSPNTVAIVAVNLLGLGDSCAELIRVCHDRNIPVIQDSAQYLPRERTDWPGDYIVLSFGRGKPLNLLHGGALVSPPGAENSSALSPARYTAREHMLSSRAAAIAFNTLTRPMIYGALSALPGTGLGEVLYKPLVDAHPLPERAWRQVGTAFELYREEPSYQRRIWAPALEEWTAMGITALTSPGSPLPAEPLRLALLAPDQAARDVLVNRLNRAGLGASRFYGVELTRVAGVPEMVSCQGPFPNASQLARRLFTLPTHALVHPDTVRTARKVVLTWHHSQ